MINGKCLENLDDTTDKNNNIRKINSYTSKKVKVGEGYKNGEDGSGDC